MPESADVKINNPDEFDRAVHAMVRTVTSTTDLK